MSSIRPSVALLRGINVGGKNKLPMKTLTAIFEELGCTDVTTYIQSGNVVFAASVSLATRLPALVTATIAEKLGLEVPVVIRSRAALQTAVTENPFAGKDTPPEALHVGFLQKRPSAAKRDNLDPDRSPGDAFCVRGKEVYLLCPNGVARTKLTNAYFDRVLDTITTFRNWKTVNRLIEMTAT